MSLITPLFLLGLLGLALPWWLHRLETQTTEREKFATTRFLEASKKRIHVQAEQKERRNQTHPRFSRKVR